MALRHIRVTRDEMRKRVAFFEDLRSHDGGLIGSHYPSAERNLYCALGFQPPKCGGGVDVASPTGAAAAKNSAIRISEGFSIGFCEAAPGEGPMMHSHDTNETFIPLTGRWRCSWELDGKVEFFDVEPWDVFSFPAGVNRRFENVTEGTPDGTHWLLFVIGDNEPKADLGDHARMADRRGVGVSRRTAGTKAVRTAVSKHAGTPVERQPTCGEPEGLVATADRLKVRVAGGQC